MKTLMSFCVLSVILLTSLRTSAQEIPEKKSGLTIAANSKFNELKMSKAEFAASVFSFYSYDRDEESGLQVKEFKVKYPGHATIAVSGNTLNENARLALSKLTKGDEIIVFGGLADSNQEVRNKLLVTLTD